MYVNRIIMGMDRVIEKKKGIQKKHIFWGAGVLLIAFLIFKLVFGDHTSFPCGKGSTDHWKCGRWNIQRLHHGYWSGGADHNLFLDAVEAEQLKNE